VAIFIPVAVSRSRFLITAAWLFRVGSIPGHILNRTSLWESINGWKIPNKIIYPICSMVLEYLSTFARTKSPSFVGFYIPAPWFAYGYKFCVFFMGSSNSGGDETFQKGLQLQRLRNALIDQPGHISCRHDEGFCEECRKMTLAVEEMAHVIHTFLHMFPAIRLF